MKRVFLLFLVVSTSLISNAQNLKKAFKEIDKKDFDAAILRFGEKLNEDSNDIIANYGMSKIFSNSSYSKADLYISIKYVYKSKEQCYRNINERSNADLNDRVDKKNILVFINDITIDTIFNEVVKLESILYTTCINSNDLVLIKKFITNIKNSELSQNAIAKIIEIEFNSAKSFNSADSLDKFINKYVNSKFNDQALGLIYDIKLKQAKNVKNVVALNEYIKQYPNSPFIKNAKKDIEEIEFRNIENTTSIDILKDYKEKYPKSSFLVDVNRLLSGLEYKKILLKPTIDDLQSFLNKYPESNYKSEIKGLIDSLNKVNDLLEISNLEKNKSIESYRKYIWNHPNTELSKSIKDSIIKLVNDDHNYQAPSMMPKFIPSTGFVRDSDFRNDFWDDKVFSKFFGIKRHFPYWNYVFDSWYSNYDFPYRSGVLGYGRTKNYISWEPDNGFYINDSTWSFVVPDIYESTRIFKEGLAAVEFNGKWGFIDRTCYPFILPQYNKVRDFNCGFAAIEKDNLWGFINKKNELVIQNQYEAVGDFSYQLAIVTKIPMFQETIDFEKLYKMAPVNFMVGDWGYIDNNNKVKIPGIYSKAFPFVAGLALVEKKDGGFGLIDTSNKIVLWIENKGSATSFYYVKEEIGTAAYEENETEFYSAWIINNRYLITFDKTTPKAEYCNYIIPSIDYFSETGVNYKLPLICNLFDYNWIISDYGGVFEKSNVIKDVGDIANFQPDNDKFQDGSLFTHYKYKSKEGIVAAGGKFWVPPIYDEIRYFSCNLAAVKSEGKWGFIDFTGKLLQNAWFDNVSDFLGDLAIFQLNEKFGVINTKGEIITKEFADDIQIFSKYLYKARYADKWKLLNHKGDIIDSNCYNSIYPLCNGKAIVKNNKGEGFIDYKGNLKILGNFRFLTPFMFDRALVNDGTKNERFFIMDENGKKLSWDNEIIKYIDDEIIKKYLENKIIKSDAEGFYEEILLNYLILTNNK